MNCIKVLLMCVGLLGVGRVIPMQQLDNAEPGRAEYDARKLHNKKSMLPGKWDGLREWCIWRDMHNERTCYEEQVVKKELTHSGIEHTLKYSVVLQKIITRLQAEEGITITRDEIRSAIAQCFQAKGEVWMFGVWYEDRIELFFRACQMLFEAKKAEKKLQQEQESKEKWRVKIAKKRLEFEQIKRSKTAKRTAWQQEIKEVHS